VGVQDVGVRYVVLGKAEMLAAFRTMRAEVDSLNKSLVSSATKAATQATAANPLSALATSYALAQKQMAADTERQLNRVSTVGKAAFFGLAGAAVVAGYEGLKVHSQFQQAMTQVTTLAGVDQSRIGALTAGIKGLAPAVGQGLVPMANALYRIASAQAGLGATNQQLLDMTRAAGQLATIGGPGTDLEQTARIIGGIKATGVKGAGDPKNIVSLAAATVGSGDIRMSDFVDFMGTGVLASGNLAGVPLKDIATFLALAGDNLQSGSVSGHSLAHGLSLLAAPSGVAEQAFQSIGLGGSQIGDLMRSQGLGPAIQTLTQHLMAPLGSNANAGLLEKYGFTSEQVSQAQSVGLGAMGPTGQTLANMILTRMFGGAKQAIPLDMLITEASRYQAKSTQVGKQMGNFDAAWGQQTNTLSFKAKQFTSSMQNLADTIGKDLTPAAKVFLGVASGIATFFAQHQAAAIALAGTITLVLGPAIGLYLVRKFAAASGALADVVRGYGKLVQMILRTLIPSLAAEDTALGTTTAAQRLLGTTALTTAGEEDVLAASSRGAGLAGGARLAGVTAAAAGSVAAVGVGSSLLLGGDTRQNHAGANWAADMRGLVQNVTAGQYNGLGLPTASQAAAALQWLTAHPHGGDHMPLVAADEVKWISSQLESEARGADDAVVKVLSDLQHNIASQPQNINVTVNLDGKQVARTTTSVVRSKVARS